MTLRAVVGVEPKVVCNLCPGWRIAEGFSMIADEGKNFLLSLREELHFFPFPHRLHLPDLPLVLKPRYWQRRADLVATAASEITATR